MNKKLYNEPVLEMISIAMEDVICTSVAPDPADNDSLWGLSKADVTID